MEPASPNTLIAFASKAGSTASDGDSKNSPFTAALVKHIARPGLDLRKAFGFVRDEVLKTTRNRQEPYVYGSLGGDDVALVPAVPAFAAPASANVDIRRDYELALQVGTRAAWKSFLSAYPTGFYADLAKGQIDKIAAEEARVTATEKASRAEEDKARLSAEGARQTEQAKAAAAAQSAEKARLAAEKARRPRWRKPPRRNSPARRWRKPRQKKPPRKSPRPGRSRRRSPAKFSVTSRAAGRSGRAAGWLRRVHRVPSWPGDDMATASRIYEVCN